MDLSRRTFIASAGLAPVACGGLSYEQGILVAQPNPLPIIRSPKVGQEWTYIKRNVFNGKILDLITERVTSINSNITIERMSQDGSRLPNEVQRTWGMVITDAQWPRILNFNPSIPLWPLNLSSSWNQQFNVQYTVTGYPNNFLNWRQYMQAEGWEKITVPAGEFIALRYKSIIHYQGNEDDQVHSLRKTTAWFSPQIGRWVARESSGSYRVAEIGDDVLEGSYQWQLISWK